MVSLQAVQRLDNTKGWKRFAHARASVCRVERQVDRIRTFVQETYIENLVKKKGSVWESIRFRWGTFNQESTPTIRTTCNETLESNGGGLLSGWGGNSGAVFMVVRCCVSVRYSTPRLSVIRILQIVTYACEGSHVRSLSKN